MRHTFLLSICLSAATLSATASADDQRFSTTGLNGSVYELLRLHGNDAQPIASLLISRSDGGATLMDMMVDCASGQYAYLAMDHSPAQPVSDADLNTLAQHSHSIVADNLRPLALTPITDDPYDAPMAALNDLVCGR